MRNEATTVLTIIGVLVAILGAYAGIANGYVSKSTFDVYKEAQELLMARLDVRTDRIEKKMDLLLENRGIKYEDSEGGD